MSKGKWERKNRLSAPHPTFQFDDKYTSMSLWTLGRKSVLPGLESKAEHPGKEAVIKTYCKKREKSLMVIDLLRGVLVSGWFLQFMLRNKPYSNAEVVCVCRGTVWRNLWVSQDIQQCLANLKTAFSPIIQKINTYSPPPTHSPQSLVVCGRPELTRPCSSHTWDIPVPTLSVPWGSVGRQLEVTVGVPVGR